MVMFENPQIFPANDSETGLRGKAKDEEEPKAEKADLIKAAYEEIPEKKVREEILVPKEEEISSEIIAQIINKMPAPQALPTIGAYQEKLAQEKISIKARAREIFYNPLLRLNRVKNQESFWVLANYLEKNIIGEEFLRIRCQKNKADREIHKQENKKIG